MVSKSTSLISLLSLRVKLAAAGGADFFAADFSNMFLPWTRLSNPSCFLCLVAA